MSHFAIWLSLFQLLLHLFAIAHFYSSKTQSTGLSQTWAPIPVFRSVICCIQRLEGNHSQLQSLSRCCSLRDERPVRGKLTRRGANNHNKPQITWKDFDHLVCFDWNGRHRRAWACTFFFFAAMVFGSVLLRRPSARTTRAHASLRWGERERAVTERQRSSKPLYLPEDFMPVRPQRAPLCASRFRYIVQTERDELWCSHHTLPSTRVCARQADANFAFSHAVTDTQKKQRELGFNIIVPYNRLARIKAHLSGSGAGK